MFTNKELQGIERRVVESVDNSCEAHWFRFKKELESLAAKYESYDNGLVRKARAFALEHKPAFYRNYRDRVRDAILEKMELGKAKVASPPEVVIDVPKVIKRSGYKLSFEDKKNRMWLEAYFLNNRNCRRAAESIGVAKSTFHDWVSKHQELIESEEMRN